MIELNLITEDSHYEGCDYCDREALVLTDTENLCSDHAIHYFN